MTKKDDAARKDTAKEEARATNKPVDPNNPTSKETMDVIQGNPPSQSQQTQQDEETERKRREQEQQEGGEEKVTEEKE